MEGPAPDFAGRFGRTTQLEANLVPGKLIVVPPTEGLPIMLGQSLQRGAQGNGELGSDGMLAGGRGSACQDFAFVTRSCCERLNRHFARSVSLFGGQEKALDVQQAPFQDRAQPGTHLRAGSPSESIEAPLRVQKRVLDQVRRPEFGLKIEPDNHLLSAVPARNTSGFPVTNRDLHTS
jgi:hypothetical protein